MSKPYKEYALNTNQIQLLKTLYKFRFITSTFLSTYKGIHRASSHSALKVLAKHSYIASHYNSSYKLSGKAARYYLAPKGLKFLKETLQLNEQVLHAMYKNKSVTERFIDHHIDIGQVYLSLRHTYPDAFDIYVKTELASFDNFPNPTPDLFLNRKESAEQYFVEIFHDVPPMNARKRLDALLEHYDDGEWQEETYPTLCFVLADGRNETMFAEYAKKTLDATGMEDEITILTTSFKALGSQDSVVWSDVLKPDELGSLNNL